MRGGSGTTYNQLFCSLNPSAQNYIKSISIKQADNNPLIAFAQAIDNLGLVEINKEFFSNFNSKLDDVKLQLDILLTSGTLFNNFVLQLSEMTFFARMKCIMFMIIDNKRIYYQNPLRMQHISILNQFKLVCELDPKLQFIIRDDLCTKMSGMLVSFGDFSATFNKLIQEKWSKHMEYIKEQTEKDIKKTRQEHETLLASLKCNVLNTHLAYFALFTPQNVDSLLCIKSLDNWCFQDPTQFTKGFIQYVNDNNKLILHPFIHQTPCSIIDPKKYLTMIQTNVYSHYVPSKNLNHSILNWLIESERMDTEYLDKSKSILSSFVKLQNEMTKPKPNKTCEFTPFYVYHGTSQIMSGETFTTFTFLSTTTNYNVAMQYASSNQTGVVYILKINKDIPFFNFANTLDTLDQILLPMGVSFKHVQTMNDTNNEVKVVLYESTGCENLEPIFPKMENTPNVYPSNVSENIFTTNIKVIQEKLKGASMNGSSIILVSKDNNTIYKNVNKISSWSALPFNQMFLRTLNEMLAAYIYNKLFDIGTLDYKLVWYENDKTVLIESTRDDSIQSIEKKQTKQKEYQSKYNKSMTNELLIDIVMSNWDAYYNSNSILKDGKMKTFRVDVGGALYYRGRGDRKILFDAEVPNDHVTLVENNSEFVKLVSSLDAKTIQNNVDNISEAVKRWNAFKEELLQSTNKQPTSVIVSQKTQLPLDPALTTYKKTKVKLPHLFPHLPVQNPMYIVEQLKDTNHVEYYKKFIRYVLTIFEKRLKYYNIHGTTILNEMSKANSKRVNSSYVPSPVGGNPEVTTDSRISPLEVVDVPNKFGSLTLFQQLLNNK